MEKRLERHKLAAQMMIRAEKILDRISPIHRPEEIKAFTISASILADKAMMLLDEGGEEKNEG